MKYVSGRDNLSVTIYAPYDCPNNCPFCTSKQLYKESKGSFYGVYTAINTLKNTTIPYKEFVITGGEPTANIKLLRRIISHLPHDKRIFVNTTLLAKTYNEFVEYLLSPEGQRINGVNISRHAATYEEELNTLSHIATDEQIQQLAQIVSVRINCVLTPNTNKKEVINRWYGKNVEVSFRADFTTIHTDAELHTPYDPHAIELSQSCSYVEHTGCNVCDTVIFKHDNMSIRYHRGKEHTLIVGTKEIEFNDIIVFPDGTISLDWDNNTVNRIHAEYMINYYKKPTASPYSDYSNHHSCGGSTCGGIARYSSFYSRGGCGGSGCGG